MADVTKINKKKKVVCIHSPCIKLDQRTKIIGITPPLLH